MAITGGRKDLSILALWCISLFNFICCLFGINNSIYLLSLFNPHKISQYNNIPSDRKQMNPPIPLKCFFKTIPSLLYFKLTPQQTTEIYPIALVIPPFLRSNLLADHRVVKLFCGEDALVRAFYYGLMKLAFQIDNQDKDYLELFKDVVVGDGEFGIGELEDRDFTDTQYRDFMGEFFQLVQQQQIPNIEQVVNTYPIIDTILLKLFKKLVPITLLLPQNPPTDCTQQVLSYLSLKFQITLENISGCYKFVQSDIFIYPLTRHQIYLVFIDQLGFIKQVKEQGNSKLANYEHSLQISNISMCSNKTTNQQWINNNQNMYSIKSNINSNNNQQQQSNRSMVASSFTKKLQQDQHTQLGTIINLLDSQLVLHTSSSIKQTKIRERNSFEDKLNMMQNIKQNIDKKQQKMHQKQTAQQAYYPIPQPFISKKQLKTTSHQQNIKSPQPSYLISHHSIIFSYLSRNQQSSQNSRIFSPGLVCAKQMDKQGSSTANTFIKVIHNSSIIDNSYNSTQTKPLSGTYHVTNNYQSQSSKRYSQIINPFTKSSNIQIQSKISQKRQQHRQMTAQTDESGYNKFTNSQLIKQLDVQFQTQIKKIKQRYKQQRRANIRKIF